MAVCVKTVVYVPSVNNIRLGGSGGLEARSTGKLIVRPRCMSGSVNRAYSLFVCCEYVKVECSWWFSDKIGFSGS